MSEDIERGQSQSAPPVPERVMTGAEFVSTFMRCDPDDPDDERRAMILAHDAANRAMHYCANHGVDVFERLDSWSSAAPQEEGGE